MNSFLSRFPLVRRGQFPSAHGLISPFGKNHPQELHANTKGRLISTPGGFLFHFLEIAARMRQKNHRTSVKPLQHPCQPLASMGVQIGRNLFRRAFGDDPAAGLAALRA